VPLSVPLFAPGRQYRVAVAVKNELSAVSPVVVSTPFYVLVTTEAVGALTVVAPTVTTSTVLLSWTVVSTSAAGFLPGRDVDPPLVCMWTVGRQSGASSVNGSASLAFRDQGAGAVSVGLSVLPRATALLAVVTCRDGFGRTVVGASSPFTVDGTVSPAAAPAVANVSVWLPGPVSTPVTSKLLAVSSECLPSASPPAGATQAVAGWMVPPNATGDVVVSWAGARYPGTTADSWSGQRLVFSVQLLAGRVSVPGVQANCMAPCGALNLTLPVVLAAAASSAQVASGANLTLGAMTACPGAPLTIVVTAVLAGGRTEVVAASPLLLFDASAPDTSQCAAPTSSCADVPGDFSSGLVPSTNCSDIAIGAANGPAGLAWSNFYFVNASCLPGPGGKRLAVYNGRGGPAAISLRPGSTGAFSLRAVTLVAKLNDTFTVTLTAFRSGRVVTTVMYTVAGGSGARLTLGPGFLNVSSVTLVPTGARYFVVESVQLCTSAAAVQSLAVPGSLSFCDPATATTTFCDPLGAMYASSPGIAVWLSQPGGCITDPQTGVASVQFRVVVNRSRRSGWSSAVVGQLMLLQSAALPWPLTPGDSVAVEYFAVNTLGAVSATVVSPALPVVDDGVRNRVGNVSVTVSPTSRTVAVTWTAVLPASPPLPKPCNLTVSVALMSLGGTVVSVPASNAAGPQRLLIQLSAGDWSRVAGSQVRAGVSVSCTNSALGLAPLLALSSAVIVDSVPPRASGVVLGLSARNGTGFRAVLVAATSDFLGPGPASALAVQWQAWDDPVGVPIAANVTLTAQAGDAASSARSFSLVLDALVPSQGCVLQGAACVAEVDTLGRGILYQATLTSTAIADMFGAAPLAALTATVRAVDAVGLRSADVTASPVSIFNTTSSPVGGTPSTVLITSACTGGAVAPCNTSLPTSASIPSVALTRLAGLGLAVPAFSLQPGVLCATWRLSTVTNLTTAPGLLTGYRVQMYATDPTMGTLNATLSGAEPSSTTPLVSLDVAAPGVCLTDLQPADGDMVVLCVEALLPSDAVGLARRIGCVQTPSPPPAIIAGIEH
jgi:hypothetical protein